MEGVAVLDCGLWERGEEKVRAGRGREDFCDSDGMSVSEDDDMTDAFLLRSTRVGGKVGGVTCTIQEYCLLNDSFPTEILMSKLLAAGNETLIMSSTI